MVYGISIRNYRYGLILRIWWNDIFDGFVMEDIAQVNAISTFVGKRQFPKGTFVYFIFLNTNRFEKSVTGNIQDGCCKFVFICLPNMSCTRHIVLKVVVKIISSESDAHPTVSALMVDGHFVKHHEM